MTDLNVTESLDIDMEGCTFAGFPLCMGETRFLVERGITTLAVAGCAIKSAFTSIEAYAGDALERAANKVRSRLDQ